MTGDWFLGPEPTVSRSRISQPKIASQLGPWTDAEVDQALSGTFRFSPATSRSRTCRRADDNEGISYAAVVADSSPLRASDDPDNSRGR
jgi:hypothetical protein